MALPYPANPFKSPEQWCTEIDALLDRLEHASPFNPQQYGPVENLADTATFEEFAEHVLPRLDWRRQKHYADRIASIRHARHARRGRAV